MGNFHIGQFYLDVLMISLSCCHYKAIDWCILAYSLFTFSEILKTRAYRVFTFSEVFKSFTWLDNYITFNI